MRRITLEALGLSKKEYIVLGVLKQLSLAQKISKISEKAEMPQATTSFVLRKLEKRKLATRIKSHNHYRWKYRKNIEFVESNLPEPSESTFLNIIFGMANITKEFMRVLELSPAERLYSIQGSGISKNILKKVDQKFLSFFHHAIKKQKIIIEGVIAQSVLNIFKEMTTEQISTHIDRLTVVYVVPDEIINFPLDIFIFRNDVLLVDYETEQLVRITDATLSKPFRSLFSMAKEYGKKIDLNSYLKNP